MNEMEHGDYGHTPPISNNTDNYKLKNIDCINETQLLKENCNHNTAMNIFYETPANDTDENIHDIPLQPVNGIMLINSKDAAAKTQHLEEICNLNTTRNNFHEILAINTDESHNKNINAENDIVSVNSNEKNDNQEEDCTKINKNCNDIQEEVYLETHLSNTEPNAPVNELYNSNIDNLFVDNDDNTNVRDISDDTWINLEEFDNILKTRQINTNDNDSPIYLDEIDEYIRNIDDNKDEFNNETLADCDVNLEIISISSDDGNIDDTETHKEPNIDTVSINSSECGSYHSSDFEFITENEAKLDGLIINYNPTIKRNVRKESLVIRREFSDNSQRSNENMHDILHQNNAPARQDHIVPEGPSFLALFQGVYNPVLPHSEIFFLENKSVRVTSMHTQFNGLGFDRDMARRQQHFSKDFEDEAIENAKKILEMYPGENRKRRRRY